MRRLLVCLPVVVGLVLRLGFLARRQGLGVGLVLTLEVLREHRPEGQAWEHPVWQLEDRALELEINIEVERNTIWFDWCRHCILEIYIQGNKSVMKTLEVLVRRKRKGAGNPVY
jgi:hypothetical protein